MIVEENTISELSEVQDYDSITFYTPEEALSIPELIDHIVNHHHNYLKNALSEMNVMAEIIAEDYTNTNDELNLLLFYFNKLSADQITHMEKEEAILFPYIKSLFNPDSDNPIEHVCFGSIKSPVSVIEMEHDNAVLELEYLRNLTNNYEAPEWAGPLLCNFYKDLETMEKDLLLHLYKENNILHPKAIEREAEIYS